jgi:hypothetical protein
VIKLALVALLFAPAADDHASKARDAQECPAIFGSPHAVQQNAKWRQQHVHEIEITDKRLNITHSVARWSEPAQLRLTGIDLVEVHAVEGEAPVAVVAVDESLKSVCEPGLYKVNTDDALGQSGQVLVVDERGVLVEQAGKLAFMPWDGHPAPKQTRMVWRSPYNVVMEVSGGGKGSSGKASSSSSRGAKKERKRKRPKRKATKRK